MTAPPTIQAPRGRGEPGDSKVRTIFLGPSFSVARCEPGVAHLLRDPRPARSRHPVRRALQRDDNRRTSGGWPGANPESLPWPSRASARWWAASYSPGARLAEQPPVRRKVRGSSPRGGAISSGCGPAMPLLVDGGTSHGTSHSAEPLRGGRCALPADNSVEWQRPLGEVRQ